MQTVKAECRYCGQNRIVEVPDFFSDELIEEEVALHCTCKEAKEFQDKKAMEERMEEAKISATGTTFELFHEDAPEVEAIFNAALDSLTQKKFKSLVIKINDKTKATLKMSKENIVVQREDKNTYTRETETT